MTHRAAGEHDTRHVRFERQRAAKIFCDEHALHSAAAEAAILFGEGRAQKSELGILRPQFFRKAERRGLVGLALLKTVFVLHEPREIVGDQALFLAEIEIHLFQSPRMALAMMLRCISLDPP